MPEAGPRVRVSRAGILFPALIASLLLLSLFALGAGEYPVAPGAVLGALFPGAFPALIPDETAETVVTAVRLPRVLLAVFAGSGLAAAGAAFQAIFRNPLATPDTLGVATGSSFGAVLAILFGAGAAGIQASALLFGLAAVALVWGVSRVPGSNRVLMIILSGLVVGAFFSSLVSLVKFAADPQDILPSITFWLMGSLAGASSGMLAAGLPLVAIGTAVLFLYRWKLDLLSLPDEEAASLGAAVLRIRGTVILASTLVTAAVVSLCGLVGWVGLLVPHAARMAFGSSNRAVMPASILLGAIFLLAVDTASRCLSASEIPISILTSVVGAPAFIFLLRRTGGVRA